MTVIMMNVKYYIISMIIGSLITIGAFVAIDYLTNDTRDTISKDDALDKIDNRGRDLESHNQQTQTVIKNIDRYLDNNHDWRKL